MSSFVTSSDLAPEVLLSAAMDMLATPTPKLIHNLGANRDMMPANAGQALVRSRYEPLPTATVPLGNSGIAPPPVKPVRVDIQAKPKFYGQYMVLNEQVTLQNQDRVFANMAKRLGVSLRTTEDELTRSMFESGASFVNCVNGVNGDNPTELTDVDFADVVAALENNDARTILDSIEGEDRFGTAPQSDSYLAFGASSLIKDLRNVTGFTLKARYPRPELAAREEWGSVDYIRIFLSSLGSKTPSASQNGNDVYNVFVCGMESYSVIDQDGYSAQLRYRDPLMVGTLGLNGELGWVMAQVPQIDNDAWVINLRTTLSV